MNLFVEVGHEFSCINQNFSLYLKLIEWGFSFVLLEAFCCTLLFKLLAECMPVTVESQ